MRYDPVGGKRGRSLAVLLAASVLIAMGVLVQAVEATSDFVLPDPTPITLIVATFSIIIFARVVTTPHRVFLPIGLLVVLVPLGLFQVSVHLKSVLLLLVAIFLVFSGGFYLIRLSLAIGRTPVLDLVPRLLLEGMKGTIPTEDRSRTVEVTATWLPRANAIVFGLHLKNMGLVASVRSGRNGVKYSIGVIDPRIAKSLYLWSFLFGRTTIVFQDGRALVAIEPRTYRFLGSPGPHALFCENVISNLETEYKQFSRSGSFGGIVLLGDSIS